MTKLARKIERKVARAENGDFSVGAAGQPLDVELRRLQRRVANAKRTRKARKQ